jgi:hypothetical protein
MQSLDCAVERVLHACFCKSKRFGNDIIKGLMGSPG